MAFLQDARPNMSRAVSIIGEVEQALHDASSEKRSEVLRRVTDLFVGEAEHFSADQTALFDSVLGQLVSHIESRAAVELSQRLAPIANAPVQTVRHLAAHDDIAVSGPILEKSERLSDDDLVTIAKTKSQAHLAKIANRARLNETVTEVLVDQGDAEVANTLAVNAGAQFSKLGMAKLVMRADGDDRLAESIGRRSDIPAHVYRQLLAQATDVVRSKLLASLPADRQDAVKKMMTEISAQVTPKTGVMHHYAAAQRAMSVFAQDTELTKRKIVEFANIKQVPEVAVGTFDSERCVGRAPRPSVPRGQRLRPHGALQIVGAGLANHLRGDHGEPHSKTTRGIRHRRPARAVRRIDHSLRATRASFLARPSKGHQAHFSSSSRIDDPRAWSLAL